MKYDESRVRWSVGQLAERFGLATHVLRHWEDEGLIVPERDAAGRRVYGEGDAYRVAVIISSKAAGMSLPQVRALVDATADDRRAVLTAHLADLEQRMAEMERSRFLTEHALACRAHDIAQCPNFRAHVQDIVDGSRTGFPAASHPAPQESGQRPHRRA